jgi:hypothetical protein
MGVIPVADLYVSARTGEEIKLHLLIDSGATVTALPRSDAAFFGIDHDKGRPILVRGIGERSIRGWVHEVLVRIRDTSIRIPIAFLDSDTAPRVLGRSGVFDRFTVVFEEARNRSGLLPNATPEARIVAHMLDAGA